MCAFRIYTKVAASDFKNCSVFFFFIQFFFGIRVYGVFRIRYKIRGLLLSLNFDPSCEFN